MQIRDLPSTSTVESTDYLVKEQSDGTTQKIAVGDFVVNDPTISTIGTQINGLQNAVAALHDAVPYRIECGVATVPAGSDRITVNFSTPFSAKPVVLISPNNSGNGANVIYTVFDRQVNFFVALFRGSTYPTNAQDIFWIALGN